MSLAAAHIQFSYAAEHQILKDLSLEIPDGGITALIGRNGCGKSTLLKILNRLLTPQAGDVLLHGKSIATYPSRTLAQTIALLSQAPQAPEGLTVKELVEFGRHPYKGFLGRSSDQDREAVKWALSETSLEDLQDRPLEALSGGQRQRAWIAMALAQDTEYLLLDEPTTYLDISHQLEVLELLAQLNEEQGKTIVMVVHDPNHASQFAHNVVCLVEGSILYEGTPKEIFTQERIQEIFSVVPQIFQGADPERPWCVSRRTR